MTTPTAVPKTQDSQPLIHVQVDQWMTEADLALFWHQKQQTINDARHGQKVIVPGFAPIGLDSEGGSHD